MSSECDYRADTSSPSGRVRLSRRLGGGQQSAPGFARGTHRRGGITPPDCPRGSREQRRRTWGDDTSPSGRRWFMRDAGRQRRAHREVCSGFGQNAARVRTELVLTTLMRWTAFGQDTSDARTHRALWAALVDRRLRIWLNRFAGRVERSTGSLVWQGKTEFETRFARLRVRACGGPSSILTVDVATRCSVADAKSACRTNPLSSGLAFGPEPKSTVHGSLSGNARRLDGVREALDEATPTRADFGGPARDDRRILRSPVVNVCSAAGSPDAGIGRARRKPSSAATHLGRSRSELDSRVSWETAHVARPRMSLASPRVSAGAFSRRRPQGPSQHRPTEGSRSDLSGSGLRPERLVAPRGIEVVRRSRTTTTLLSRG